jgi:ABC-type transport system involved in multi-copper enzyme maturation permease subunit
MNALGQTWLVACHEWADALRSRRALVMLALYLVAAGFTMYGTISILHGMESELVTLLKLPQSDQTGMVSATLWKSEHFQRIAERVTKNPLVLRDITGRHPVELIYAWFVFIYTPLLVVLVSSGRIAEDLGSGVVRYAVFRVSRASWSLGKFIGQAMMIGGALLLGGMCAYAVAEIRLAAVGTSGLFLHILQWSVRAWVYSIPFLGLALGLSHLTRSPSRATLFGILAICVCSACPPILNYYAQDTGWRLILPHVADLFPNAHKMLLWRSAAGPLVGGSVTLVTLGVCYLLAGYAFFRKRDM